MTGKPPAVLDDLWDAIPTGIAPIDELVARGGTLKRRQRRRRVLLAAAAAVLVTAGGGLAAQTLPSGAGTPTAGGRNDASPSNPPQRGSRLVGIGRVAVEVPADWASGAASCNVPVKNTAYFPWPQDCIAMDLPPVSSVAITAGSFAETGTRVDTLHIAGSVNGFVRTGDAVRCYETLKIPVCRQTFGIPDLDAYFTATVTGEDARDRLGVIRDSLTVLPFDRITVPFTPAPMAREVDFIKTLHDAGLAVRIEHDTCPPNASCLAGVVDVRPAPGSVVPVGSTVTLTVLDR